MFLHNFLNYKNLLEFQYDYKVQNTGLTNYINDILLLTPSYNDITALTNFFPEKVIQFENFELSNMEPEEGVFEALSTPDLKIFYPEPFIASPSFVHEDL